MYKLQYVKRLSFHVFCIKKFNISKINHFVCVKFNKIPQFYNLNTVNTALTTICKGIELAN